MQSVPSVGSDDKNNADSIGDNAGDAFGGRNKTKSKKEGQSQSASTVGKTIAIQQVIKQRVVKFARKLCCNVMAANITSKRQSIHKVGRRIQRVATAPIFGRMELDSHADTIVLGRNAIVLQYTNRVCDVAPYADSYKPITDVPIVRGATAVTSQATGQTCILVFNEAIWMADYLDHLLLNPNQMRHHGVTVQDNSYSDISIHLAFYDDNFIMPMQADGTTIFFDLRTPTDHELAHCPHIELSSNAPWNPRDVRFPPPTHRAEEGLPVHKIHQLQRFDLSDAREAHLTRDMATSVISEVRVEGSADIPLPRSFSSVKRHTGISAKDLSEKWFLGLAQAAETIKATTQKCVRSAVLPLSRQYRADRVFEKPLLCRDFYTDTMDERCKSLNGNRYAQVMANKTSLLWLIQ